MKKNKKYRRTRLSRWSKRRMENFELQFQQERRANWSRMVPEIAFVLLKCNAIRERSSIRDIAEEAFATYPGAFETWFNGKKIPDHSLVLLTLGEAKKREW